MGSIIWIPTESSQMEEFIGTWKFQSSDNFEEYLKALGIPLPLRKLANLTSPTVIIKRVDDEKFSVTTDPVVRAITVTFKLGETVEENTVDLRTVSSVFEFDMETKTFIWTSTDKHGVVTVVKRTISGDKMNVCMECCRMQRSLLAHSQQHSCIVQSQL